MEKVKIIVNRVPERAGECPFAIHNHSEISTPPHICRLKCNNEYAVDRMQTFSSSQRQNCSLETNEECPYLKGLEAQ